jgi:hypothetical protein
MMRRAALWLALGTAPFSVAWGHGPSGGGPDDPEASARALTFDTRLADASSPPDERPLPWVAPVPADAPPQAQSRTSHEAPSPVSQQPAHLHAHSVPP